MAAIAAVSARNMRGPSAIRFTGKQHRPLARDEAAFGAGQDRCGRRRRDLGHRRAAFFVGEQQGALGGPGLQQLRQLYGLGELGKRCAPALLARFDHLRREPLLLDPLDDRSLGDHRLQPCDAEFGRLFDDPVEPRLLDRREAEPEIGHRFAGVRLLLDADRQRPLDGLGDGAQPFATDIVEQQQRVADLHPHHPQQIMSGGAVDHRCGVGAERLVDVKTGCAGGRPGGSSGHG
jgi:hypothetical protein